MLSDRSTPEDEICPVRDELLGALYRANRLGVPDLVAKVTPDIRASLALFCYRRSHLQTLGLTIAESCSENDLVCLGGRSGAFLFAKSREALPPPPVESHRVNRRMITLATGPLRVLSVEDESDAEAIR